MLSFDKQKNKFQEFLKERKYRLSLFGSSPGDDWKLILLTIIFVLGLISASGILTHLRLLEITEGEPDAVDVGQRIIELETVDAVIGRFIDASAVEEEEAISETDAIEIETSSISEQ